MTPRFDHKAAEARWQAAWAAAETFRADDASPRPKTYVLEMFPYPSGRIHMGHVRNYTMGDVIARLRRMQGMEVLHPMGWDAFGMPAENAAMERGVHPGDWTRANIATMRGQLQRLGFALDWSRELATCEPDYYGHEQALFLDLMAAGLVTRKLSAVNWDPVDMTVLANEQVVDGRGWRSGALVERRQLSQWFLKITDFADELLDGLGRLDHWPDKVRLMQENWIGKSQGLRFTFDLADLPHHDDGLSAESGAALHDAPAPPAAFDVFTTRPDTLFGASFAAVAADHPLAAACAATDPGTGGIYRRVPGGRDVGGGGRDAGQARPRYRLERHPSARSDHSPAGVRRQFRADGIRHRRDLRLPGARSARPRFRPEVRLAGDPRRRAGGPGRGTDPRRCLHRPRRAGAFALSRRPGRGRRQARHHRARRGGGLGHRHHRLAVARLGRVAPALLGHADPGHPLPVVRRGAGAARATACRPARGRDLRRPGNPLERITRRGSMSAARSATRPRPARQTRSTPS